MDFNPETLTRVFAKEPDAVRSFVRSFSPIVQVRVARGLLKRRGKRERGRSVTQEVEDVTQEIMVFLFEDDCRPLRAWSASGGLSLTNWIGFLAERQVSSLLRSGTRRPWRDEPTLETDLVEMVGTGGNPEHVVASRELFARLVERLKEELTPRGMELFHRLLVEEESVEAVCASTGMTTDAVYAWRSRLARLARKLATDLQDSDAPAYSKGEGLSSKEQAGE